MKLYVWDDGYEVRTCTTNAPTNPGADDWKFLGTVDLPIEKPKEIATVTIKTPSTGLPANSDSFTFHFPQDAKNIRCLYDVEVSE